jgi:hypothetical protein
MIHTTAIPAPTVVESPAKVERSNARTSGLERNSLCWGAKFMLTRVVVIPMMPAATLKETNVLWTGVLPALHVLID